MKLQYLAFGGLCAWAVFGTPNSDLAALFWAERPAPWEGVDAFYYPNRYDLSVHRAAHNVGSLDGCRAWVREAARADADPALTRGDYECGVGKLKLFGGMTVYRIAVR